MFCYLLCRDESKIIQQILERIFNDLNRKFSTTVSKDLVGIDSRVNEMLDLYLNEGLGGVRFVNHESNESLLICSICKLAHAFHRTDGVQYFQFNHETNSRNKKRQTHNIIVNTMLCFGYREENTKTSMESITCLS